jgi:hypothetical protein
MDEAGATRGWKASCFWPHARILVEPRRLQPGHGERSLRLDCVELAAHLNILGLAQRLKQRRTLTCHNLGRRRSSLAPMLK